MTSDAAPACPWFLFQQGKILLDRDLNPPRWTHETAAHLGGVDPAAAHRTSRQGEPEVWAAELAPERKVPEGLEKAALREVIAVKDDAFFRMVSRASQLLTWAADHRHCGRCGSPTVLSAGELSMSCPGCGLESFPRVSPAVIVTVLRADQILLARARRFPPGMYSVLAGFVEAGESLEECVHREIREECAIEVGDLRYFGSQSWPFPHSLMVAYIATHVGGEIVTDPREIVDARWFGRDNLPELPLRASIARRMIEWYRAGGTQEVDGWRPGSY